MGNVAVYYDPELSYPKPPFNPPERYPELSGDGLDEKNSVYAGVRALFRLLEFDGKNFGKKKWNPLGGIISEGDNVLIKPNFVLDLPPHAITHASLLRPIIDYSLKALDGSGHITIADAPLQSGDFERIKELSGLSGLVEYYREKGVKIDVIDLRKTKAIVNEEGVITRKVDLEGDPSGYATVDLGHESYLDEISADYERYRVTEYNREEMIRHHNREKNEYMISKTVLDADVVINIPKLKTHKKGGMTCALKNVVGINGDKSWLPHHRAGAPSEGGDEYPKKSLMKRFESAVIEYLRGKPALWCKAKKVYWMTKKTDHKNSCSITYDTREGSWHGNDTIWRTILDLNTILLYVNKEGELHDSMQRRCLTMVDGVMAGEGEGPIRSTPKHAGLLVSGTNQADVDYVCAMLMGFNPEKIKMIKNARKNRKYPLATADTTPNIKSNVERLPSLKFRPPSGWMGHIEA